MEIDPRYHAARVLFETGHIKLFQDIFLYIPKTTVYKDLGINFNRFDRAILDPSIFRMEELITLSELFDIDARKIIDMVYEQVLKGSQTKSRRSIRLKPKKESH